MKYAEITKDTSIWVIRYIGERDTLPAGNDSIHFADLTGIDPEPEIGWLQQEDGSFTPPPTPEPKPRPLSKLDFSDLLQDAGGMTDAMLVASRDDAQLRPMWIKFELATDVARDHVHTQAGLAALAALGYLPDGVQAVLDAWPTEG